MLFFVVLFCSLFYANPGLAVDAEEQAEEQSKEEENKEILQEVMIGNSSVMYIEPHLEKDFDVNRVVSYMKEKENVPLDEIEFPRLIVGELSEDEIMETNKAWESKDEKIQGSIKQKFLHYLSHDSKDSPVYLLVLDDNETFSLYVHKADKVEKLFAKPNYILEKVDTEVYKGVSDVNTAVEVFLSDDGDGNNFIITFWILGVIIAFSLFSLYYISIMLSPYHY